MSKYLITGITGFAGPHLANLLLKENHEVHGLIRNSNGREQDIRDVMNDEEYANLIFHYSDLNNRKLLDEIFINNEFDGVFHLAAQSHPPTSFLDPVGTFNENIINSANLIQSIVEDGSAADADIKPMDIIIKVDDREVNQPNELQSYVASKRAGEKVVLTLFRDGDMITRTVTLKSKDGEETVASSKETKEPEEKKEVEKKEISFDEIGFSVRNMSESELESYKADAGVLITKVEPYSKAFNQRLRATLVIVEADKNKISSVSELEDIINDKKGSAVLLKMVDKNGNSQFVGLEIPN